MGGADERRTGGKPADLVDVETAPSPTASSPSSPSRAPLIKSETLLLLKNAGVPPGGFEQQGVQFAEKHSFLLSALFRPVDRSSRRGLLDRGESKLSSWWASVKSHTREYWTGFTKDHWIIFLQTFVTYVVVLAIISPDAVYEALSYGGSFQPVWGIIYLLMMCVLGGTVGMNTLLQLYVFVSLVFAGCFGLWIRHMTYLAAGSDWSNNDLAKGATYTVLMSVSCGAFNILRWRWDVTNPLFFMCSIFLIFTQGSYSGPTAGTLYLQPVYSLINISIATVVFTITSWVLMPLYSASKMRMGTAKALQSLGRALLAERDLILGPIDEGTGLLEMASGKVDMITGRDTGLFDQCDVIGTHINAARALILGNRPLRVPCLLEIDVYKSHGLMKFPVLSFMHVDYYSHTLLSIITNLARPVKMGNTNMRKLQRPDLRQALDDLFRSFDDVLCGLAASITENVGSGKRHSWKVVDNLVEASHDCWLEFLRAGQRAIASSDCVDENFGVKIVSIFLYEVGSRIRELYFSVAIAVSNEEPMALDLAFARVEKRPAWILSRTAYEHIDMDPLEIIDIQMMGMSAATVASGEDRASFHDAAWLAKTKKAIRKAQHEKNLSAVLASEFGLAHKSANLRPGKAFRIPLWVIMGLQYVVTISIALILTVIPAVNREVFNNRGNDVLFTVVVMWQPNIGSLNSRAFNRALGTAMAAIWSYVLLGITYGATGATWADTAQKWIVSGFLGAVWGAFCMLNGARYRTYSYMWFVAAFTVALVTLSLLREPTPPWADAAERLLNVIYGIIISWLVAVFLFPISAWRMVTDNYANSCSAMRDAVLALADLFESTDSPHSVKNEVIMTPLDTLYQNEIGISAMYRPFEQPNLARAMSLSNRARRITSSTAAFIGPAENESMIFRRPRMIPKGHLTRSIHASNIFIDYIIQVLSLKMEFFPQAAWKVKPDMYEAISSSFAGIAKVLDLMDGIIHLRNTKRNDGGLETADATHAMGAMGAIDDMIDALDAAARSIERLTVLSRETLESFVQLSTGVQDMRAPLQNAEILVVYLSLSMFMQAKAVLLASSNSFLFNNPDAQRKIEDAVNRRDFLSQLTRGPESIIMHLLEVAAVLNRKANASRRCVPDVVSTKSTSLHTASTISEAVASELKDALDELISSGGFGSRDSSMKSGGGGWTSD